MTASKTFYDVPLQDVKRTPLVEGEEHKQGVGVFGLLEVATGKKDGSQIWRNFKKAAKASSGGQFVMPRGVKIFRRPMQGKRSETEAVTLSSVPMTLAVILDKDKALRSLQDPGLKLHEALVHHGLTEESARAAIELAVNVADPAMPEDLELVKQVTQLFGSETATMRFKRIPRHGGSSGSSGPGDGTVLVFSAIDLVMAVKKCGYTTAQPLVWHIFRKYYGVDPEGAVNRCSINLYRPKFAGLGQRQTLALDIQGALELLCLIPGSDVSANLRRRAVDTMLRVEGGDESLIDRIKANRRFQEYLAENDPDHPLRAAGEYVEANVNVPATTPSIDRIDVVAGTKASSAVVAVSAPVGPARKRSQPSQPCGKPFFETVKRQASGASATRLKEITRLAYAAFVTLVATDEGLVQTDVTAELKDGTFGLKAMVAEKWSCLAEAAVASVLAPTAPVVPVGDAARTGSDGGDSAGPSPRKKRGPFVAVDDHGHAKDVANQAWVQQLQVGGKIFYLDSWTKEGSLELRTTTALLRRGHWAENLFSANPDLAICEQLRREGVNVHRGDWKGFVTPPLLDSIYLDLCSGSESYVREQLEHATLRAAEGCVCGLTITERDFNGDPLVMRALGLADFMSDSGWKPAMHRLRPSTQVHRSTISRQQALTQFWRRAFLIMPAPKTFCDVPAQDVGRAPLAQGEEQRLAVVKLVGTGAGKDGSDKWQNYQRLNVPKEKGKKSIELPHDVTILQRPVVGTRKAVATVALRDAPVLLALVFDKVAALRCLQDPELKLQEALVSRGLSEADAAAAIEKALRVADPTLPGDVEIVGKVTRLFGADGAVVRFKRVPHRGGNGSDETTLVFSAIDLVMVAKNCGYTAAWELCRKIFDKYYRVNLEDSNIVSDSGFSGMIYKIRFSTGEGGKDSLALDVQGASELLCLIPGSDVSADLRRRAVDTMLRVEGGDESLIDRIKANRKFQEYLSEHDPDHPLRAVGEHAERRQAEEEATCTPATRRRKAELELELEMAESDAKIKRFKVVEAEKKALEADHRAAEAGHASEAARVSRADVVQRSSQEEGGWKLGVIKECIQNKDVFGLNNADVARAKDMAKSILFNASRPPSEATGSQLFCEEFLIGKGLGTTEARAKCAVFGKYVLKEVTAMFPAYDVVANRTARHFNGAEITMNTYWEIHRPAFEAAYDRFRERNAVAAAPTAPGGATIRDFFPPQREEVVA